MWLPDLAGRNEIKYLAIVEALGEAIANGDLLPGERLPTHRDLAWRLKVNVSTVTQAYREATRRHLISGEVGRGTYVLADSREATLFALKDVAPAETIDLSTNIPAIDPENRDLETALRALLKENPAAAQGYPSPALLQRARIAGATWLAQRGLDLKPQQLVLTAGAQQALAIALLALAPPGAAILTEAFAFPGIKAAAKQLHYPLHGVSMDGEGITPSSLDRVVRATDAKVLVLVPNLQNPTGAIMGKERRQAIAEIARKRGLMLIEDDVYGALSGMPPLAADLPERTLVVTSLSKSVAPGLRFGMIGGPTDIIERIVPEVHGTSWLMAPLMLELSSRWIEDGTATARVAWQRAEVEARYRMMRRWFGARPGRLDGGKSDSGRSDGGKSDGESARSRTIPSPHAWLATHGDPEALAARCREQGVEIAASSHFAVGPNHPQRVRLSLTAPPTRRDLSLAFERLHAAGFGQR